MNIKNLDLNLLVALKALLEEKHVSRAAIRIGLSQPAMSRALARLRDVLKDPLLIKSGHGLELTTRATELYQPLLNVFSEVTQIVTPPETEPALMQGEISIATRDNEMVAILPQVINQVAKEAPRLTFRVISLLGDDLTTLEQNKVDFIMTGTDLSGSTSLCRATLYKEEFVCLVSAKNPVIKDFTLEKYASMKHCMVSISGFGPGFVDVALAQKGLSRNITLTIPHFLAASFIVANTDLIVTLPKKIGVLLSQQKNIKMLEPPLKLPSFTIYLYWHIRNQNNPTHKWLRRKIRELV